MVSLVKVVDLNLKGVFGKIENLSDGKTIDFHNVNKDELNEISEKYGNNPSYSIRFTKDVYSEFFNNMIGSENYMVSVDRAKEANQNA